MRTPVSPFEYRRHQGDSALLFSVPHSGRIYPEELLSASCLSVDQLRRAEDAWVDTLVAPAARASGTDMLVALLGRTYVDLNRAPVEIDPAMLRQSVPPPPAEAGERVAAGLGVVPRIAAPGLNIYARRLDHADVARRIAEVHAPYHARLREALAARAARHGYAVLLDWHSMPTPARADPPAIILGDRHGKSAHPALVALIEESFTAAGLSVARNHPYAGGFTTATHANPAAGIHVVQVEIDRGLYMDPATLAPTGNFHALSAMLSQAVRAIAAQLDKLPLAPPQRFAAE